VIGVVLAGGLGSRMGTAKARIELAGRPLIAYPLAALSAACDLVVVVAKADSDLGGLDTERWDEPDEPRHPLAGITYALERAREPILVCGADMPFVTAEVLQDIAAELRPDVSAVVAVNDSRLEPLLAAYAPSALEPLRAAPGDQPLRRSVEALEPAQVDVAPEVVFNVNTPGDLAEAERRLRSG
jgi:molybdopterin-guanine dinucleotide biosynthesis protein A